MDNELKSYPAPWQGRLVLACRKCQKKLRKQDGFKALSNLRKTIKRRSRHQPQALLHVLNVPCMDLCPKHAVTICVPAQSGDRLRILRSEEDVASLDL